MACESLFELYAQHRKRQMINSYQNWSRILQFHTPCPDGTSEAPLTEACLRRVVASELEQAVHIPMLDQQDLKSALLPEAQVSVASGWTESYGRWWQEQTCTSDGPKLFGARLIGNGQTPQKFTALSFSDLACCSNWGHNRVIQHSSNDEPLHLILPVFAAPRTVHQMVAGMLCGKLALSARNVEAILVLANAVGFEPVEAACVQYLSSRTHHKSGQALLCLTTLGDYLGLSKLCDEAVDALIQKPWVDNMHRIAQILAMPMIQHDTAKMRELLHHPRRGAYSELQVLEMLEMINTSTSEDNIAAVLNMETMQPAELDTLLGILVNDVHDPGILLRKAVQWHRSPDSRPDWSARTRIVHNVMMPDIGKHKIIYLPHTDMRLKLDRTMIKDDGSALCGLFLQPPLGKYIAQTASAAKIFALCTFAPYLRYCVPVPHLGWGTEHSYGRGYFGYVSDLCKLYPEGYHGPFTLGVWWEKLV